MVEVQLVGGKPLRAVLAGEIVPFEHVLPGEFHLLSREPVVLAQHDDRGDAKLVGHGVNHIVSLVILGRIQPRIGIMGGKMGDFLGMNDLGVAEKKQSDGSFRTTNVHRLPEAVENQDLAVERRHGRVEVRVPANRIVEK